MTRLLDHDVAPTDADFQIAVGGAAGLWARCRTVVTEQMGAKAEPFWDGRPSGWVLRARRAGRPFVTLTPHEVGFSALVILGRAETPAAEAMRLSPRVRAVLDGAHRYPDGTWLFVPVEVVTDLDDVLALLMLKLPPTVRRRLASTAPVPA